LRWVFRRKSPREDKRARRSASVDLKLHSVGHYTIEKSLGKGRYGKVKLALDTKTNRKVAIKILNRKKLKAEDLVRIQRELKIMQCLHHPNLVALHEVLRAKDVTFMVMEYCAGGNLRDFMWKHPGRRLSLKEALRIFRQILAGLHYCHQHMVIHRDIKPENILLTDSEATVAKIADFGFSRSFKLNIIMRTDCGSLAYCAPEVIDAEIKGYLGPKSDVWSMGCILYETIIGDLPFYNQQMHLLLDNIRSGKYRRHPLLTDQIREVLDMMLMPDPDKRASLDEIIKHPLIAEGMEELVYVSGEESEPRRLSRQIEDEEHNPRRVSESELHVMTQNENTKARKPIYAFSEEVPSLFAEEKENRTTKTHERPKKRGSKNRPTKVVPTWPRAFSFDGQLLDLSHS